MRKSKFNLLAASALLLSGLAFVFNGCNNSEKVKVSEPYFKVGEAISTKTPLSGIIKGTLKADSTYTVNGDIFVNDTLVVQPGVHVNFPGTATYSIIVKGTFLSLGTKEKPIWFTVPTANAKRTDTYGAKTSEDPAYQGFWGGILGETTFNKIIIKWTHLEFGSGKLGTSPVSFLANGANSYTVTTANPKGILVLEDSWIYGSVDDPFRPFGGRFNVMRNTFEKCGYTGGEAMNIKSGSVGNFAYNLVVGAATNGPKASNNGGKDPQTNFMFYNNTMVECGFRRIATGRGGSTNFEGGSRGGYYNNLMINCKYGPRVVAATANYAGNALVVADTANIKCGNNYNYVDDLASANQIYPTGFGQKPQPTDIPAPSSFLPAGYKPGAVYDGTAVLHLNNPKFVNYTLPRITANLGDVSFVGTADFHLTASSPAAGKGNTSFLPLTSITGYYDIIVPVDPNFGSSEITPPGKDIGAFQLDGTGNRH